jgi:hypothetical protein
LRRIAQGVPREKLADYIGKELAEDALREISEGNSSPLYTGLDLNVGGGEGMRGFYDRMLPDFARKFGKRWGAEVRQIEVPTNDGDAQLRYQAQQDERGRWFVADLYHSGRSVADGFRTLSDANQWIQKLPDLSTKVWGMKITPEK